MMPELDELPPKEMRIRVPLRTYDFSTLSRTKRRYVWENLVPYILEPGNVKKRNRLRAFQAVTHKRQLLKKSKHYKRTSNKSRELRILSTSSKWLQESLDEYYLRNAPPPHTQVKDRKAAIPQLLTTYLIVFHLMRLKEYEDIRQKIFPSLQRSRLLLRYANCPPGIDPELYKAALKDQQRATKSWSKYHPASHLVFGYFHATRDPSFESSSGGRELCNILGLAMFARQFLTTTAPPNTKQRPLVAPDAMLHFRPLKGVEEIRPDLPALTDEEIAAVGRLAEN